MMQPETRPVAPQDEIREHSKLEGRNIEGEDVQASQPSTIGSLGNVEEHKTSTPSKMQRLEKLGIEISQKIRIKAERKVNSIREMITRVFGEKVDTCRDNDQPTRRQSTKINAEIRNLPKRQEKTIETEGQGPIMQAPPQGLPIQALGTISGMGTKLVHQMPTINEMRDRIAQYGKEINEAAMQQLGHVKQKFVLTFGEKVNPAKDLDPSVKDNLTRLNEDIKKLPRRDDRVIETEGTATTAPIQQQSVLWDPLNPYENFA